MFHDVKTPLDCIFYILDIQKLDLDEVGKVMF
jgi:hypothetical protein